MVQLISESTGSLLALPQEGGKKVVAKKAVKKDVKKVVKKDVKKEVKAKPKKAVAVKKNYGCEKETNI